MAGAGAGSGSSRLLFGRESMVPQYYLRKDLSNVAGYGSSERLFLMPPIAYRNTTVFELVLSSVTPADRGEWTCLVENRVGEIRASVYLDVFGVCVCVCVCVCFCLCLSFFLSFFLSVLLPAVRSVLYRRHLKCVY